MFRPGLLRPGLLRPGLVVLALVLLLAAPAARANSLITALRQMPAAPELYQGYRIVEWADLSALKAASEVPAELRMADFDALDKKTQARLRSLLERPRVPVNFAQRLVTSAPLWPELLGFDFLQLGWLAEIGAPGHRLLFLGGEGVPNGAGLAAALARAGLAPVENGGVTLWILGEKDYAVEPKDSSRDAAFPFWGYLRANVRLWRGDGALVGAQGLPDLQLAVAVEREDADSLIDLPRFDLAAKALSDPALSAGPVLQATFVELDFGEGIEIARNPGELPPYGFFAFADRQDEGGQQLVIALLYAEVSSAAEAAALLRETIAAWHGEKDVTLGERFDGLEIATSVFESDEGAAAVVRLSVPTLPALDERGRPLNRSALYAYVYRLLQQQQLGFLAPRG